MCDQTSSSSSSPIFRPTSSSVSLRSSNSACHSAGLGWTLTNGGHFLSKANVRDAHDDLSAAVSSVVNQVSTLLPYSRYLLNVYTRDLSSVSCLNLVPSRRRNHAWGFSFWELLHLVNCTGKGPPAGIAQVYITGPCPGTRIYIRGNTRTRRIYPPLN